MGRTRSIWRGLVMAVAATAFGPIAAPAFADASGTGHTVSITENQHGTFTDDQATNPCTGAPGVAVFDGNVVEHITFFPGEDELWATFTETGKVSVTWSGVTYTGRATAWGNFNVNEKNANATFTLSLRLFAADGSSVVGHGVTHFASNANGEVAVSFDKPSFTCT
jgi:hypothetical protein